MRLTSALISAIALTFAASPAFAAAPSSITVTMKAENKSGESGTATLTQMPDAVKIVVSLTGAPAAAQPTHIHPGTCSKLNPAPEYPLESLVSGKSTTMLKGKKLADLTGGKFSINVHKSTEDLKTYVSCGEIK